MAFSPAFLDEIRARVSLAQVIGRRVKLVRAGREWKACCPFHEEKTPSFYVNEDKGFYHCFGCGAHGDVIRFLTEQEGLRFPDAVRQLAAEAGLEVPEETPEAHATAQRTAGLHEVTARAAKWFAEQLAGLGGGAARQYLERRGIDAATARRFGLGLAPDGRARLKNALGGEIGEEKLVETGLLIRPDEGESYDRFRDRLMFPIYDARGRVVGFGGRILGDGQPKYLNSPDTPLFDKGRLLYNLDKAAGPARKSQRLFVVEGYMDVIALAQAGIEEAVAPLGTALTEVQLQLLWRVVPEPLLCFDGDAAGTRAALRAAARALPLLEPGRSLRFISLPAGQDPDDLVRGQGPAAFEALAQKAETLIDRLWRAEVEGVDLATPERRASVRQRLREYAQSIGNASVAALYEAEFRARFDAMFMARRQREPFAVKGKRVTPPPTMRAMRPRNPQDAELAAVIVGLLEHPVIAEGHVEAIAELPVSEPRLKRLRSAILDAFAVAPDLDKNQLSHTLAAEGLGALADEVRISNRLSFSFTRAETPLHIAARDLACVVDSLMARRRIEEELSQVTARLRQSMAESDFAEQQRLLRERMSVDQELIRLAQRLREEAATE